MQLRRNLATAIVACGLIAGTAALAAPPPVEWDGMQRVSSKRFDHAYLAPGADFRGYTKVIIEPTEVAFRKNWRRDYNSSSSSLAGRVSERDIQEAVTKGASVSTQIISDAWRKAGYAVVTSPAEDTLKVRTGVVNVSVNAPDVNMPGRSYSFADEAGQATFVVELRDSLTNALLGRAVDTNLVGDNTVGRRNSVTNRGDFRDVVERWAEDSLRAMSELKRLSGTP